MRHHDTSAVSSCDSCYGMSCGQAVHCQCARVLWQVTWSSKGRERDEALTRCRSVLEAGMHWAPVF